MTVSLAMFTVLASGLGWAQPEAADKPVPRFEPAECRVEDTDEKSECGYVVVPQDRGDPDAGTIRVAVQIFKSTHPSPAPDPVIFLAGGPGNPSAQLYKQMGEFETNIAPWLARGDVIVYDRRGGGFSEPSLDCPEVVDQAFSDTGHLVTPSDWTAVIERSLLDCAKRLRSQGVKLEAYNSIEDAADVADIRKALGIEAWNLIGVSYGSRLALTILRYQPEGLRSAVIHSVDPPLAKFSSGIGAAETLFFELFRKCARDPGCNRAYPKLDEVFYETIEKYDATPVRLKITVPFPGTPLTGKTLDWNFTGGQVSGILYGEMYSIEGIRNAPRLIYAFHNGDEAEMAAAVVRNILVAPAYLNFGQLIAFSCMDTIAFETHESLAAAYAAHPGTGGLEFGRIYSFGHHFVGLCEKFADMSRADMSYQQAVVSPVPTLIVSGELDSATPHDNAILAAGTLTNGQLFMVPGAGHSPLSESPCTIGMALEFLAAPMEKVDGSCIAKAFPGVDFVLPKE
jgi:pimeloyl-ACP methyl ester carboxylesterase